MKFPELCERLVKELGVAKVASNAYPGLGTKDPEGWGLWVHDGVFDVGDEERGEWVSTHQFMTEEEACDSLYKILTRKPRVVVETPQERERSRKVAEEAERKWEARKEYWRQHGEYSPEG